MELGHHLTHVAWAEAYHRTKWQLDPSSRLATTDMGQKLGGGCALFWGELGPQSPSNIMSPGLRTTSVPSGILMNPAIWSH